MPIPTPPRRRFGAAPFGPVTISRDATGLHGVSADGRHVHVALPADHRFPDGNRFLAEGVPVTIDGKPIAVLSQTSQGISRRARRVHVADAGSGVVPPGAYLTRRWLAHVWLQTDHQVLVRPVGPMPFNMRRLRTAPGISDELALAFTVIWPAVEFAV